MQYAIISTFVAVMETLAIENFGGLTHLELEVKPITVLIGPQGSGKSITAKLLFFCKQLHVEMVTCIRMNLSWAEFAHRQNERFARYFPKEAWPKIPFKVKYIKDSIAIDIESKNDHFSIGYSEHIRTTYEQQNDHYHQLKLAVKSDRNIATDVLLNSLTVELKDGLKRLFHPSYFEQHFIPAGRSFFATIQQNIFSFISENRPLDPFLVEFGLSYENFRDVFSHMAIDEKGSTTDASSILNASYQRVEGEDYLIHPDGRLVKVAYTSSGQQKALPLTITTSVLTSQAPVSGTVYIEEPEAHLFPVAQKSMVQLLATLFNKNEGQLQEVITTHSPYILSSFNNLLEAGSISVRQPDRASSVAAIVPQGEQLAPGVLGAYLIAGGKATSLIDADTNLVSGTVLDSISNEIANEFGALLDVAFD